MITFQVNFVLKEMCQSYMDGLKSNRRLVRYLLISVLAIATHVVQGQVSYTWNGSTNTDFGTGTNWTPNGIPGNLDNVTINTALVNVVLDQARTISALTMNSANKIHLNGFDLTVNTTINVSAGIIDDGTFASGQLIGNNLTTINFRNVTTDAQITISSQAWNSVRDNTFNGIVFFTHTGNGNSEIQGGNTYNNDVTFRTIGNRFRPESTFNSTFNGSQVDFIDDSPVNENMFISQAASAVFNSNIRVSGSSSGSVRLGSNGSTIGSITLASGFTITTGSFSNGDLYLHYFTKQGAAPLSLAVSNLLGIENSEFFGDVDFSGARFLTSGTLYHGTFTALKSGTGNDSGLGGNTFEGVASITNSGSGIMTFASTDPDIFNAAVTITNSGSSQIQMANNSIGNLFNENITVNSTSGSGVYFGNGAVATVSLASGKIISVGTTFSSGSLILKNFTQAGPSAQALTLTGTALLQLGPASAFNGDVTFISPRVFLNGTVFSGTSYIEKNGASNDNGTGGNTFVGSSTIVNSGSGYLMTGNSDVDIFNDVTLTNTGSNYLYVANSTPGNLFNGNIVVNNTSGSGIYFCNGGAATATLALTKTITVGGTGFTGGQLRLYRFTQLGPTAQALTLTGTALLYLGPTSEFSGDVTFAAPRLIMDATTYNGTAYIEKTGTTADNGPGGSTFNNTTTIVNSGDSYLLTGASAPDMFNGDLTVTNTGASQVRLSDNSVGNEYNGNILLNSTFGGGIYFGGSGGSTSTLAATKTIAVGGLGVITGDVRLINFTQVGATDQTLNLSGIAVLTLGPSSSFGGNVDFRSPQLYLNGTTFSGTAYLEKTGAITNTGTGGNVFTGAATIVNSGSSILTVNNTIADTYNNNVTYTNTGSSLIQIANNVSGTAFNGNITFNSTLGSPGIYIGNGASGGATLAAGGSLLTGGSGFSSGELRLIRFSQLGGSDQSLILTGTGLLRLGPTTIFTGNVDFRAPQFALDGTQFNGTTYLEKTGAIDNVSNGGNIFAGATTIANSGTGYFRFAVTTLDTFSSSLTLINTGAGTIRLADVIPGTIFNGNIQVNSTFGGGIYFGNGGGSSTLAAGLTISVGGSGFTTGNLILAGFNQAGATAQNLTLTSSALLTLGPSSTFGGNVDFRSPRMLLNGAIYGGTAYLEKTGATNDTGSGGNTFNQTATIVNSGPNYFMTGNVSPDIFNNTLTVTNSGAGTVRLANNSVGNQFNSDVIVNSTVGGGVYFGNGGGNSTLANGRTLTIGGSGFSVGELIISRLTQTGGTAQSLTLTGTGLLRIGPSTTFNGDVNFVAPQVHLQGGTFNGVATIQKSGATNNDNTGGNIFNGTTTLTNSSTARWRLSGTNGDTFNGPVTFVASSSGLFQPAYNTDNTFTSNITTNSAVALSFGTGTGRVVLSGGNAQTIDKTGGSASPIFNRMALIKSGNDVTLNTIVSISVSGLFTTGVINSSTASYPLFLDNATVSGANNNSYVNGPVRKTGDDAFEFPVGTSGFYRPISISAPAGAGTQFEAQYILSNATLVFGTAVNPSFWTVSGCEYWLLNNTAGTPAVSVTLSWLEASCNVGDITMPTDLRVSRWNGSIWTDLGNGGVTGSPTAGTIVTAGTTSAFGPFTLASITSANPLPVELLWFKASLPTTQTVLLNWRTASELNNAEFSIERSVNGFDYTSIGSVQGNGTTEVIHDYHFIDEQPLAGQSYYRLKQVDFNGDFQFSDAVAVLRKGAIEKFVVYPNAAHNEWVSFNRLADVVVLNTLSQEVLHLSQAKGFDTTGMTPGIYLIRTNQGDLFRLVIW